MCLLLEAYVRVNKNLCFSYALRNGQWDIDALVLPVSQHESGNIDWENASFLMPNLVLELPFPVFKDTIMVM